MTRRALSRAFVCALAFFLALAVLRLAGVIDKWVSIAAGLLFFVMCLLLLAYLGGSAARGIQVLLWVTLLGYTREFAPSEASLEFYAVAAQVIPVLLLVLAIELRAFRLPLEQIAQRHEDGVLDVRASWMRFKEDESLWVTGAVSLVALFSLIAGELQAISQIAKGGASTADPRNVFSAIVVGLLVVSYFALFGQPSATRSGHSADG